MTCRSSKRLQSRNPQQIIFMQHCNHFKDLSKRECSASCQISSYIYIYIKKRSAGRFLDCSTTAYRGWERERELVFQHLLATFPLCNVFLSYVAIQTPAALYILLECKVLFFLFCFVLIVYDCLIFFLTLKDTHIFDMYIYCKFAGRELRMDGWMIFGYTRICIG